MARNRVTADHYQEVLKRHRQRLRKVRSEAEIFNADMGDKHIGVYASSAAFFLFLSWVPIIIVICSVLPYTSLQETDLINAVTSIIPSVGYDFISSLIHEAYVKSAGILSVSVLMTIWTASAGMLALFRGLNAAYEIHENRNYFILRIISIVYLLLFLIVVAFMLAFMFYIGIYRNLVADAVEDILILDYLMSKSNYLIVFSIGILIFQLMYTYIPSGIQYFRFQWPGAVFSAAAWALFTWSFSIYVSSIGNYNAVYGSLATVIVVMVWLYFCIYILLIGGHINKYFYGRLRARYLIKKERKLERKESRKKS